MPQNKKCRLCNNNEFSTVIDFGMNPLVNSLIDKKDLNTREETFPLLVVQCNRCKLVQIKDNIDSHEIYKNVDYLYFSGDMPGLSEYFEEYAEDIMKRFLDYNDFVFEIGSNDGTMLKHFKEADRKVLGIDPASNVVVRALRNGIPTVAEFFSERLANSIKREFGQAKVIYGNNCIAHLDNLHDLMAGVKTLLMPDGVFIVECNYWGGMVKNKNYSLIYHDHFSYFTVHTWMQLAEQFGMYVFDAIVTPAQGGSLRIFMDKGTHSLTRRYRELLKQEMETKLNSYETCVQYRIEVLQEAKKLGDLIRSLRDAGKSIAGYGAAAKGFSILKLADIDERYIDYFVDDSPAKQGKYTPISHIPVISREEAEERLPNYFFITAPNYADVIMKKEKEKGYRGKFILSNSEII